MKIVTPVSHLFKEHSDIIIENSDMLEVRDYVKLQNFNEDFYHPYMNILAKWNEAEIERLKYIARTRNLTGISFHIMSRYQNNKENGTGLKGYVGVGKPMSKELMLYHCSENCKLVREMFGDDIIIMVENIPYLFSDAYDEITEPEFITKIIEDNGIFLLLDIAHAGVTCINKMMNFSEYMKALPLDKCLQIHLSRYEIKDDKAYDTHDELAEEDWDKLKKILQFTKNARFITLEYYKDVNILIGMLKRLRKEIK